MSVEQSKVPQHSEAIMEDAAEGSDDGAVDEEGVETASEGTDLGDEEGEMSNEEGEGSEGASTLATDDDDESTDEEEEEEEEEEQVEYYPLPPLPPVHVPPKVHGIATAEVYSIIKELRRQMDDPVEREHARSMLQGDTDVLLAVAQVLQEAHLLRRSTVNAHGEVEEHLVRQPEAPRPPLPTGYNSWIVETAPQNRR